MLRLDRSISLALLAAVIALPRVADAQRVVRWTELNAVQLAEIDRAHTAVLIPAGIVEEQGTLLPTGAEVFRSDRLAADIATAIAARPGWTALLLPTIPLGSGAFDRRTGRAGFGGSLPVRAATMQAIFSDIATALGEQGFVHLFVIDGHGDANHARALDAVGDWFGDTFRGRMIHLLGRRGCHVDGLEPPPITLLGAIAMTADADSPHGGAMQTARHWWLRQDLVDSASIRQARDQTAGTPEARTRAIRQGDWPGYLGAPRFATLELGAWLYETERRNCSALANRFLDGLAEQTVPRYADRMRSSPDVRAAMDAQERLENDAAWRRQRLPGRSAPPL